MKTKTLPLSAGLFMLCAASSRAATMGQSPALDALRAEEQKDPAALATREQAKTAAGEGFTGEKDGGEPAAVPTQRDETDKPPRPNRQTGPSYTMPGVTPLRGLTIHTPKLDPKGDGRNTTEGPQSPIKTWMVYGALAIGAGATVAGLFFPPLLFLGGLGLGIGAVLWFIKRKLG